MRYVIKKAGEGYFTEMKIVESEPVSLKGQVVGHNQHYRPLFEAFKPSQATKFDTQADAKAFIDKEPTNSEFPGQYGHPEAFVGCTVEPETKA